MKYILLLLFFMSLISAKVVKKTLNTKMSPIKTSHIEIRHSFPNRKQKFGDYYQRVFLEINFIKLKGFKKVKGSFIKLKPKEDYYNLEDNLNKINKLLKNDVTVEYLEYNGVKYLNRIILSNNRMLHECVYDGTHAGWKKFLFGFTEENLKKCPVLEKE